MKDSLLLKISLICSLAGIAGLFLVMHFSELETFSTVYSESDTQVVLEGVVKHHENKGELTVLSIEHVSLTNAVVFEELEIEEGLKLRIEGVVDEYKGKKELIIEKITYLPD